MSKGTKLLVLFAAVILSVVGISYAQMGMAGRGMMGQGMMGTGTGTKGAYGMMGRGGMGPAVMMGQGMMGCGTMGMTGMMHGGVMGSGMMGMGIPSDSYLYYQAGLKLSDKQIKQLGSLSDQYRKAYRDKGVKLWEINDQLAAAYTRSDLDYGLIRDKMRRRDKITAELRDLYFNNLEKSQKILTKEQKNLMRIF